MKWFHYMKRKKGPRLRDIHNEKFENYIDDLRLQGFSKNTIDAYTYNIGKFLGTINKPPKFVTSSDIRLYLVKLTNRGLKERSLNQVLASLKSYFREYLGKQLFRKIKRSKIPKDLPRILTKEEIQEMIKKTKSEKHKLIIRLLYETGVRVGECVKIKIHHIHEIAKLLYIYRGKGNKDRYVPLNPHLFADIIQHVKEKKVQSEYLFSNSFGHHISKRTVEEIIKQAAKRANIHWRVYPHMLRACFATHMLQNNVPIETLQKLMGHVDRKTTLNYNRMPFEKERIPALL